MEVYITANNAIWLTLASISAFNALVFLQSGLDKVFHFADNKAWLSDHFSDTFIGKMLTPILGVLTALELAVGVLSALVLIIFFIDGMNADTLPLVALAMMASNVTMLALIFGQRVAKDYAGAASLVPYYIVALIGLITVFLAA